MKRRVDELHSGDLFRCIQGKLWRYLRRDHDRGGAHWAQRVAGEGSPVFAGLEVGEDCFAGSSLVEVVAGTIYETPQEPKQ